MKILSKVMCWFSGGLIMFLVALASAEGADKEAADVWHGGKNLTLAALISAASNFTASLTGNASDSSFNSTFLRDLVSAASSVVANRIGRNFGGRTFYGDRHDTYTGTGWGSSGVKKYGASHGNSNYYKSGYNGDGYPSQLDTSYGRGGGPDYGSSGGGYGQTEQGDNSAELLALLLLLQGQDHGPPPFVPPPVAPIANAPAPSVGPLLLGLLPLLGLIPQLQLG